MKEIYLEILNKNQERSLIIEGDAYSVWAYLLLNREDGHEIEMEGFICSRGTVLESDDQVMDFIRNGLSTPLVKEYQSEFSVQKNISNEDFSVEWSDEVITIQLKEEVFLIMDLIRNIACSKSVSKKGIYGTPLTKF